MYSSLMNWERGGGGTRGGEGGGGQGEGKVYREVCVLGGGGRDRGKVWRRERQLQTTR